MEYDILKLLSQAPQTNMSVMQPSQELPLALMNAFPPEPGFPVSGAELVKISKSRGPASDAEGKLRAKQLESLEAQRAGIEQFNQKIAEQEGKGINPLVAGLMGASDLFSGTNNLAGLQQQKQAQENKSLQNQVLLQNMKRDLTDAEVELLKADAQKQKDMRQEDLLRLKLGQEKADKTPLVTASETSQLADLKTQLGSVNDLWTDWESKVGGIDPSVVGGTMDYLSKTAQAWTPNTELSKYDDTLKQKAQLIGKALEGGKLTDVDYAKYVKFLPQVGDTKERAQNRIENLKKELTQAYENKIKSFGEAGYKTQGFSPIGNGGTDARKRLEELRKKKAGM